MNKPAQQVKTRELGMKISINTDFPDVARQIERLSDEIASQATARALNRTVEQGRTAMSREIRQEFVLPAAKVNSALRIERARFSKGSLKMEAMLESPSKEGRSLNLINFAARQTKKGVTFRISRAGGRKLIQGAFIANQGRTVFIREGKKRLPIKALQTIDVAQMFNTQRINAKVVETLRNKFPEIFQREAKFYTDRFNNRRAK
jgi:hypothetical protein